MSCGAQGSLTVPQAPPAAGGPGFPLSLALSPSLATRGFRGARRSVGKRPSGSPLSPDPGHWPSDCRCLQIPRAARISGPAPPCSHVSPHVASASAVRSASSNPRSPRFTQWHPVRPSGLFPQDIITHSGRDVVPPSRASVPEGVPTGGWGSGRPAWRGRGPGRPPGPPRGGVWRRGLGGALPGALRTPSGTPKMGPSGTPKKGGFRGPRGGPAGAGISRGAPGAPGGRKIAKNRTQKSAKRA